MSNKRFPYTKHMLLDANVKDWRKVTIYKGQMRHGRIVTLGLWFPKGCGNLVKVRFDIDGEKIPALNNHSDDYYVGDDVRFPILINKNISMNTEVTVEYMNFSTDNKSIGITWEIESIPEKKERREEKKIEKPKEEEKTVKHEETEREKMPEPKITIERKTVKPKEKKAEPVKIVKRAPTVIKKKPAPKPIPLKPAKAKKSIKKVEEMMLLNEIFDEED